MVKIMKLNFNKGEPVFLKDTRSQEFIGEVKAINNRLGRIVLKDLVQLPARISIPGYRNFDKNEIMEIRSAQLEDINGDSVLENPESEPDTKDIPITEQSVLQSKNVAYIFITDFGSDYASAIATIKKFSRIGFIALDAMKGRLKRASIVSVSTPTDVFVFDLLVMGDRLFEEGLGEVLQSPEIEKIIHDSRLLSDCLKSKHAVSLENVRDLEAEDIMVIYQVRKMLRKHRRTLEYLIKVYFGNTVEGLDKAANWDDRPLDKDLLQRLANITSYLIPLQEAIEEKYMRRLINASRLYYSYVRDLDLFDFLYYEHEKTPRKEMIKIVSFKEDIRGEFK